jgi:hypothetical protein
MVRINRILVVFSLSEAFNCRGAGERKVGVSSAAFEASVPIELIAPP